MLSTQNKSSGDLADSGPEDGDYGTANQLIDFLVSGAGTLDAASLCAELRHIFPYQFCAYAQLSAYDGRILRLVNISAPETLLGHMGLVSENRDCSIVKEWFQRRRPVAIEGLLFHAQLDPTGTRGIGFCFGIIPPEAFERCAALLRVVTPYLYAQLARNFWAPMPANAARLLTPREIQVIEWMYYGKTNEEIATLLGNSVYTVKNHVQRILLKLSATNRTQAVLRAVDAGLVKYSDVSGPRTD